MIFRSPIAWLGRAWAYDWTSLGQASANKLDRLWLKPAVSHQLAFLRTFQSWRDVTGMSAYIMISVASSAARFWLRWLGRIRAALMAIVVEQSIQSVFMLKRSSKRHEHGISFPQFSLPSPSLDEMSHLGTCAHWHAGRRQKQAAMQWDQ